LLYAAILLPIIDNFLKKKVKKERKKERQTDRKKESKKKKGIPVTGRGSP
jgi:hypothetical protein